MEKKLACAGVRIGVRSLNEKKAMTLHARNSSVSILGAEERGILACSVT